MLSNDQIKTEYKAKFGREITAEDLAGVRKLMKMFDCEDVQSYAEFEEKIHASVEMMCGGLD